MKPEVQNELIELYERYGALNPEEVVVVAKDKKSALHSHFQWDDTVAAHQHRLEQARRIIRVAVTVIPALSNQPVKQFVSISGLRGSDRGSYISTVDILSDDQKYEAALHDALKTLERLKYQYSYIKELKPVWNAIEKATGKVRKLEAA